MFTYSVTADKHIARFYEATKEMSPSERATYMEKDEVGIVDVQRFYPDTLFSVKDRNQ